MQIFMRVIRENSVLFHVNSDMSADQEIIFKLFSRLSAVGMDHGGKRTEN